MKVAFWCFSELLPKAPPRCLDEIIDKIGQTKTKKKNQQTGGEGSEPPHLLLMLSLRATLLRSEPPFYGKFKKQSEFRLRISEFHWLGFGRI